MGSGGAGLPSGGGRHREEPLGLAGPGCSETGPPWPHTASLAPLPGMGGRIEGVFLRPGRSHLAANGIDLAVLRMRTSWREMWTLLSAMRTCYLGSSQSDEGDSVVLGE